MMSFHQRWIFLRSWMTWDSAAQSQLETVCVWVCVRVCWGPWERGVWLTLPVGLTLSEDQRDSFTVCGPVTLSGVWPCGHHVMIVCHWVCDMPCDGSSDRVLPVVTLSRWAWHTEWMLHGLRAVTGVSWVMGVCDCVGSAPASAADHQTEDRHHRAFHEWMF